MLETATQVSSTVGPLFYNRMESETITLDLEGSDAA